MILNLTQHEATEDQEKVGVYDFPEESIRKILRYNLTFEQIPTQRDMYKSAVAIADLALEKFVDYCVPVNERFAMIGGAPFFMSVLENVLLSVGITPLYSFSKRESKEVIQADGSVQKVAVFRHIGFVEVEVK